MHPPVACERCCPQTLPSRSCAQDGRLGPFAVSNHMTSNSNPNPASALIDGPLLRPDEAARLLSVRTSWVYEAVRAGKLPCIRVGRHIRLTRQMLDAWLASQTRP